jgi:ribosomal protein S18 acetylase RimI-like enzyme
VRPVLAAGGVSDAAARATYAIRPYEDADFAAVCAVHDRARPLVLVGSCDPRAFVPLADDAKDLVSCRESEKWVAVVTGVEAPGVVGFAGRQGASLSWLYVDPAWHGRGVGRALLREALAAIGGDAWTITPAGNLPAIALYESEGFRVVKTFSGENAGYPVELVRLARSA